MGGRSIPGRGTAKAKAQWLDTVWKGEGEMVHIHVVQGSSQGLRAKGSLGQGLELQGYRIASHRELPGCQGEKRQGAGMEAGIRKRLLQCPGKRGWWPSLGCYLWGQEEVGERSGLRLQAAPGASLPRPRRPSHRRPTKSREQSPGAISLFQLYRWDRPGQAGWEDAGASGKMGILDPPPLTRNLGKALKAASPQTPQHPPDAPPPPQGVASVIGLELSLSPKTPCPQIIAPDNA